MVFSRDFLGLFGMKKRIFVQRGPVLFGLHLLMKHYWLMYVMLSFPKQNHLIIILAIVVLKCFLEKNQLGLEKVRFHQSDQIHPNPGMFHIALPKSPVKLSMLPLSTTYPTKPSPW